MENNEKIVVIGFYPSPSTGDKTWEYCELDNLDLFSADFKGEKPFVGKFKIMTRTRKWLESLPELD